MNTAERVYEKLKEVPPGMVVSYAELARAAGMPRGSRAVGRIMSRNPYPGVIPCHRVIMSDGRLGGYGYGGSQIKAHMLQNEGVPVEGERVRDHSYMYHFPS